MFSAAREKAAEENMISEGGRAAQDVQDTAGHIKETVHRFKNDTRAAASAMKEDLEEVARRTGKHVREIADSASGGVIDAADSMAATIRQRPLQSSLIALGVGVVLGALWRR